VTTEVGIETGSTRLIAKYMAGKPKPFKPEEWPKVVLDSIATMNEYDWYPLATIITGLPGETEENVIQTLELLDELSSLKLFIVPLFFVTEETCYLKNGPEISFEHLSELQKEIFIKCWKYNIREWGTTFFSKYASSSIKKLFLKIAVKVFLSILYTLSYTRKDSWRKKAFKEISSEIIKAVKSL